MEEGAVLEDRPSGLIIEENSFPSLGNKANDTMKQVL